jgi:hypothetical protein
MLKCSGLVDAMAGRLRHGLVAGAVASTALLTASALLADELVRIGLSYRAAEGCPEAATFRRAVERRSSQVRFVGVGSGQRELEIALRTEGDATVGELRLTEPDGSVRQRSVSFGSCAEAVEGLALITAVSLDPQASLAAESETRPAPVARPAPEAPPPQRPRRAVPASRGRAFEAGLGVELDASFNALAATALGGALSVDVASTSDAWFAPLLRGTFSHLELRGVSQGGGEASFSLTLATLAGCPVRLGSSWLSLRPCAFASGGALHAWGSGSTPDAQARTRPYWSWGGSLLLLVRATQTVDIVSNLGVGSPLVRDQFRFDADPFWRTPTVYVFSGIGARFVLR